ncbi:MAG: PAS domain S-box protein, partial [Cyanobacteria bacterium P01_F01_bin.86]
IQHQIHLKALLNNIPHFVWLKDAHGRYIAVNETYEALYGITMADMVGLTDYEVWPIELAKAYVTDDAEVLASGQRKTSIGQFPRADGKLLWLEKTRTPFYDAKGQLAGTVGIAADITDRKTAELALQESEERFRRMTENVPGMIFRYVRHADGQDELTYVSSQVQDLFEVNPESALENTLWNRVHPDDVPRISHDVQVSAATLEPLTSIYRLILPEKGLRWVQNMASVERLENGDVVWDGIVIDISDRKQAEEQLRKTLTQLEASNNELEAFAYSVSHDLRAPLRAINGFSQALLEDYSNQFDEDAEYYFERIQANANRMGRLIDGLLRLSRVSRSELSYTTVDLSALAQEALHDLQSAEPDRSINLIVASGLTVLADSALMRIVMMNLLENAWKFTSNHATARIEFGVLPPNSAASPDPIYFVKDDGAGFDMAYSHKLFGVFQRLHSFDEFPGTGIGLASVRRAIHRHGGQVWAEAAVQQGATIFFTVPSPSFQTPVE